MSASRVSRLAATVFVLAAVALTGPTAGTAAAVPSEKCPEG
ncbi:hypothetical protein [Streptomyces sp. JJ36]|nr:hypothetical protein [Streptomyces sp. JJ36]